MAECRRPREEREGDPLKWILPSRLRKNYGGAPELHWSAHLGQQKNTMQDTQEGRPARPQQVRHAEVEVKVERKSDSFFLSLDLSLNLPESWRTFSASCYNTRRR
jgi:hypothetical protein